MSSENDRYPVVLQLRIKDVQCIIEALVQKCVDENSEINSLRYDNQRYDERLTEIERNVNDLRFSVMSKGGKA